MLAHHWQRYFTSGADALNFNLADPLRIGRASATRKTIFLVAGCNAIVATVLALSGVDQHSPAHLASDRL